MRPFRLLSTNPLVMRPGHIYLVLQSHSACDTSQAPHTPPPQHAVDHIFEVPVPSTASCRAYLASPISSVTLSPEPGVCWVAREGVVATLAKTGLGEDGGDDKMICMDRA
jgi:hypothetical protein